MRCTSHGWDAALLRWTSTSRELLPSRDCWIAEVDGEIVGAVVTELQPDHLFVENVAVLPTAQGHGVGTALLAAAEDHAVRCGLQEVRLYTNEAMTENLAFYPRRGYAEIGHSERNGFRRVLFSKNVQARTSR